MTPLTELLVQRDTVSASELLAQLQEGLAHSAAQSGAGAATHQLLLDYFKLNAKVGASSFAQGFQRYPHTAQALLELCQAQGLTELCVLMQSVMEAKPSPSGAFKASLQAQANDANPAHAKGVAAFIQGFSSVAFADPGNEADIELSLAWSAVEDCLLDQVAIHADVIAFDWGPTVRAQRQREQTVRNALADRTALQMLQALLEDAAPQVVAQPSDYDMDHAAAPRQPDTITVHHIGPHQALPAAQAADLARHPAAAQLLALYQSVNGAALFCTDRQDLWSAGFVFLPAQQWDTASAEVVDWLSSVDFQDDPDALPDWVRSAIPFGKIPGDASYWIVPVEGPCAGTVMLSNDDVSAEEPRYPSFDHFVATLCLQPEQVLGCGGYVSYPAADDAYSLYPVGYRGGSA